MTLISSVDLSAVRAISEVENERAARKSLFDSAILLAVESAYALDAGEADARLQAAWDKAEALPVGCAEYIVAMDVVSEYAAKGRDFRMAMAVAGAFQHA